MSHKIITIFIALVWFINGAICKLLNYVPRHQKIVARILGEQHAGLFTIFIGAAEIIMAFWIISGRYIQLNCWTQIIIIAIMNILEFFMASDLLLWKRFNLVFAFLFILLIYFNGIYKA
ncbi:DoxX-like family protein [Ferruginibacter albus]|uniref:DoxX-like family protein n=1 Tax=Ferruginibacter albus TaxID=2875540 RepID=UPI001CC4F149|nr:DoxX-like family protein [Ferruginibacter albus]UAY51982.1 DoxX-like family protein [Ferruginibacter albus]